MDAWVRAGRSPSDFFTYLARYAPTVLGVGQLNQCMFEALHQAAELLGHPDMVPAAAWECFTEDAASRGKDFSEGLTWKVFRAYVKLIVADGSSLSLIDIDRNRHNSGHRRLDGFQRIHLENGLYYCALINVHRTGHSFVLRVQGRIKTAYDGDVVKPLEEYGWWFERIVFVRLVISRQAEEHGVAP